MYSVILLALAASLTTALPENWAENYKTYKGYKVLEVVPNNQDEVKMLRELMLENHELDFWQEPSRLLEPVHIMVSPKEMTSLSTKLRRMNMAWKVYKDHIERDIEDFIAKETVRRAGKQKAFDIDDFNTYEDIMNWLQNDALDICDGSGFSCTYRTTDISSVEGKSIPVFEVSSDGNNEKPVFFMDATVHAREWLTTATILKIIDFVINGGNTADDREFIQNVEFVFMPVYNPDGYDYSWTDARLWRKNRQPFGACIGVDLNRNCDVNFAEEGVSTNPCSDLYCGPNGNSEPETQAFDEEFGKYSDKVNIVGGAYVTFHSYGNMWMHPWGNTVNHAGQVCERADDHDKMFAVADATADAIEEVHNTLWARGTSCEVIYETTGATDDYVKHQYDTNYPYNPELRGNGFIIDASEIQPSFEEVWAGLVEKYKAILRQSAN